MSRRRATTSRIQGGARRRRRRPAPVPGANVCGRSPAAGCTDRRISRRSAAPGILAPRISRVGRGAGCRSGAALPGRVGRVVAGDAAAPASPGAAEASGPGAGAGGAARGRVKAGQGRRATTTRWSRGCCRPPGCRTRCSRRWDGSWAWRRSRSGRRARCRRPGHRGWTTRRCSHGRPGLRRCRGRGAGCVAASSRRRVGRGRPPVPGQLSVSPPLRRRLLAHAPIDQAVPVGTALGRQTSVRVARPRAEIRGPAGGRGRALAPATARTQVRWSAAAERTVRRILRRLA